MQIYHSSFCLIFKHKTKLNWLDILNFTLDVPWKISRLQPSVVSGPAALLKWLIIKRVLFPLKALTSQVSWGGKYTDTWISVEYLDEQTDTDKWEFKIWWQVLTNLLYLITGMRFYVVVCQAAPGSHLVYHDYVFVGLVRLWAKISG